MQAIEECPVVKKKGRRKKIIDTNDISPVPCNYIDYTRLSSSKKKTKGAKIIDTLLPIDVNTPLKVSNVILHLKCNLIEIDEFIKKNIWNSDNLNYNPSIPTDIIAYEHLSLQHTFGDWENNSLEQTESPEIILTTNLSDNEHKNVPIVCSKCNQEDTVLNEQEYQKIKQLKIQLYRNDLQDKKSDCFWCTYPYDNDPCYILQYGFQNDIYGHGSFCSPECGVAYLFGKQMNWDDSAKTESFQLMNYYYGKPNQFQQSIKPALSPYYFLDKYYGNLSIQEYRKLTKSQHMMLVVDKPVTRILPEIHEDNENISKTTFSNSGKYKVKRQSQKTSGPSRNTILREKFGLTS